MHLLAPGPGPGRSGRSWLRWLRRRVLRSVGVQTAISGKFCTLGAVPRLYMYSTYLIRYTVRS